jgi:hypothetical protein
MVHAVIPALGRLMQENGKASFDHVEALSPNK